MIEVDFQKKIIDDFHNEYRGGMAYKQSNRFLAGVPDLRLAHRVTGEWNIEVKYVDHWPRGAVSVALDLTPLQRRWGRNAIAAGMNWGWCMVIGAGARGQYYIGGQNYECREVNLTQLNSSNFRGRGQGWKAYELIHQIRLDPTVDLEGQPRRRPV